MLEFRQADPFPHLDVSAYRQTEICAHAAACDRWLGFRIDDHEAELSRSGCRAHAKTGEGVTQQIWLGLDPQKLLTPYIELRAVLEKLKPRPGKRVIDLGAAYGRMGLVLARHFPNAEFIGYEYVGERVREANRILTKFGATRARVEHVDLSAREFSPEDADIYFLYDYGALKAIEKTLYDLRRRTAKQTITLVVRGRHSRYLIDRNHRWLTPLDPARGEGQITIYRSQACEPDIDSIRA